MKILSKTFIVLIILLVCTSIAAATGKKADKVSTAVKVVYTGDILGQLQPALV